MVGPQDEIKIIPCPSGIITKAASISKVCKCNDGIRFGIYDLSKTPIIEKRESVVLQDDSYSFITCNDVKKVEPLALL